MFRVNGLIIVAVALVAVVALRGRGSYHNMQEV